MIPNWCRIPILGLMVIVGIIRGMGMGMDRGKFMGEMGMGME